MKWKLPFWMLLLTLMGGSVLAQNQNKNRDQNLEAIKIGFITKKLKLTADEAQRFWPVYNAYQDEMKQLKKQQRKEIKAHLAEGQSLDEMSDEEAKKRLDIMVENRQKELDIFMRYNDEFQKVLPPYKVVKLYVAEQNFTRMLLRRLNESEDNPRGPGRNGGPGPNNMPPRGGR